MFYHCLNCQEIIGDTAIARTFVSDPLGTGDSPDEVELFCPVCGSGEVVECVPCDCLQNPTLDGFDDCAHCILSGMYNHNTEYDAGDFEDARRWLAVNAPAEMLQARGQ